VTVILATMLGLAVPHALPVEAAPVEDPQAACPLSAKWGSGTPDPDRGRNFVSIRAGKASWNGIPVSDATLRAYVKSVSDSTPRATLTLYRHGASCAVIRRIVAAIEVHGDCKPAIYLVSDSAPPAATGSVPPPRPLPVPAPIAVGTPLKPINPGSWVTNDDYPAEAIRSGQKGTVSFVLDVDHNGVTTKCVVENSSGSTLLDTTACTLLNARARFQPARDKDGKTISAQYHNRFRWELPERDPVPLASWVYEIRYTIGENGEILSCKPTGYHPGSDDQKRACATVLTMPHDAAKKLRGTATGPVTIVVRYEHAVSGMPMPPLPALSPAFKQVTIMHSRQQVQPDGDLAACYVDWGYGEIAVPFAQCRMSDRYLPGTEWHVVNGTGTVLTDGDPDVRQAFRDLDAPPPQPEP
jgi:TonB family protein